MILLLTLGMSLATASCSDTQVNRYADVVAARRDRLFERGWVPDVLPDAAGPLVESHDLDTNARCACSKLSPESVDAVISSLEAAGFARDSSRVVLPLQTCPFKPEEVARAE